MAILFAENRKAKLGQKVRGTVSREEVGGSSLGTGEKPECEAPDANRWGGVVLVLVH